MDIIVSVSLIAAMAVGALYSFMPRQERRAIRVPVAVETKRKL
jgi:hypothetical protein